MAEPGTVAVVLCVETDDYTYPRGWVLSEGRPFAFSALLASGDFPPGVEVGVVYLAYTSGPRRGMVVAELLDQDCDGAEQLRRENCRTARATGRHDFVPYAGRESCRSCGMARPRWGRRA